MHVGAEGSKYRKHVQAGSMFLCRSPTLTEYAKTRDLCLLHIMAGEFACGKLKHTTARIGSNPGISSTSMPDSATEEPVGYQGVVHLLLSSLT